MPAGGHRTSLGAQSDPTDDGGPKSRPAFKGDTMTPSKHAPTAYETSRTFVGVSLGAVVAVISLISIATLGVVWFCR